MEAKASDIKLFYAKFSFENKKNLGSVVVERWLAKPGACPGFESPWVEFWSLNSNPPGFLIGQLM